MKPMKLEWIVSLGLLALTAILGVVVQWTAPAVAGGPINSGGHRLDAPRRPASCC